MAVTRIAITSGKGGVGKTCLSVNLAVALSRLGHRVGLIDADFALGNVDIALGLAPEQNLGGVLAGTQSVDEITLAGPAGVRVIPAGSGVRALTTFNELQWSRLVAAVLDASRSLDFLLFDTATGISDNVLDVIGLADSVIVVTSYEPAAVVDAYAVVKLITLAAPEKPIGIVVNAARDARQGDIVFRQLSVAAERFLNRSLRYDGYVFDDAALRGSVLGQVPVLESDAAGPASRCIRRVAHRLAVSHTSGAAHPWAARPLPGTAAGEPMEAPCT